MKMKSDHKVDEYLTRLVTLTNQMKNCGDVMIYEVVIKKVMITLTTQFDHIVEIDGEKNIRNKSLNCVRFFKAFCKHTNKDGSRKK